jgi:ATP-dependent RNA helicase SrmB
MLPTVYFALRQSHLLLRTSSSYAWSGVAASVTLRHPQDPARGRSLPMQFDQSTLSTPILRALEPLGYLTMTPVQQRCIPEVLAGRDLRVSARTGTGKTAAFLLPMLEKMLLQPSPNTGTRGLILVPTRELALQTSKVFASLAKYTPFKCGLIIGGEAFKHQVASLRRNPEVIVATPGRLVDHIEKGTPDFRDLEFLVLDEADRMLDMGFAIDMNTIAGSCNDQRQTLLFSATLKHHGLAGVASLMREPLSIEVKPEQDGNKITQQIILADDLKHKEKLVVALIAAESPQRVFVFCNTREQTQRLGNVLKYNKLPVDSIHGEIPQSQRKQVMNRFRHGQIQVLVATDVAARGLDIDAVDLIINFDVAQSGDDHVHRIGRTGRAGASGMAVTLVLAGDWDRMSSIERYLKLRFEHRTLPGLKAKYRGPRKLKNSGKAAGSKKKKTAKGSGSSNKPKPGAGRKSGGAAPATGNDGFGALKKRK